MRVSALYIGSSCPKKHDNYLTRGNMLWVRVHGTNNNVTQMIAQLHQITEALENSSSKKKRHHSHEGYEPKPARYAKTTRGKNASYVLNHLNISI